jgi:actin-like ATPase involved in cell morphogenesis
VAREFKRRIADPVPIYIDGSPYSARRLTAVLLRWVIARTSERIGAAPSELTLTYPANWGAYRRGLLDDVCSMAGVDGLVVTYRTEPEAAASQYVFRSAITARGSLLVYDLGGGTFDVCVLDAREGAYAIVGRPAGLDDLGGIDFDELIFRRVLEHCTSPDVDHADPATITALNRLRRECTDAKEALSADVDVTIPVVLPGIDASFRLLRRDFEEMIRPSVLQTVAHTRHAIEASQVQPSELGSIVLVGGSSRIPLVSELLFRELGVPVAVDTHPKHDVALGAALGDRPTLTASGVTGASGASRAEGTASFDDVRAPTGGPFVEQEVGDQTAHSLSDKSAHRPARGLLRKRPSVRSAAVGAVVLGVGVAAFVVWGGGMFRQQSGAPTPTTNEPSITSTPSRDVSERPIPRSAVPLGTDTLVWPRVRGSVWGIGSLTLGGEQETLAQDPSLDSSFPVLSPDRRSIIYLRESAEQWALRIVAADGGDDQTLLSSLPGCRRVQTPAWGPDGLLALPCQKSSGAGTALQLVTLDGHVDRILDRGFLGDPSFSEDGRTIVYWRNDDGSADGGSIYRISADGSGREQLTEGGDGVDNDPVISPDGRTVAFRTKRNERFVIATIPLERSRSPGGPSKPRVLSNGDADEAEPSWSSDGKRLAFVHGTGDARDLWVMNADGTRRQALTDDDLADAAPAWSSR